MVVRGLCGVVVLSSSALAQPALTPAPPEPEARTWTVAAHVGGQHSEWADQYNMPDGAGPAVNVEGGLYVTPWLLVSLGARGDRYSDRDHDYSDWDHPDRWYRSVIWALHVGPRVAVEPVRWLRLGAAGGYVVFNYWGNGESSRHDCRFIELNASGTVARFDRIDVELTASAGRSWFNDNPNGYHIDTINFAIGGRWRSQ